MKKDLLISVLFFATSLSMAGEAPKTTTAVVQFTGRVVEAQCALDLGTGTNFIALKNDREMIPVDLTFHRCDEETKPKVRIIPDKRTADDNAFSTNTDATVRLYRDGEARDAICMDEDLLCGAQHRINDETDHTYRAMWVKVDNGRTKKKRLQSAVNMEIQFD